MENKTGRLLKQKIDTGRYRLISKIKNPQNIVCFSLLRTNAGENQRTERSRRSLHMFYYPKPGGVPLKVQKLVLLCRYSTDERSIARIIQGSFDIFLRKELQNVKKRPCSNV